MQTTKAKTGHFTHREQLEMTVFNILIRTNESGEMLIKTQIKITMLENEQDAVSSSHTRILVNTMQKHKLYVDVQ
jgi:hypothetical protein